MKSRRHSRVLLSFSLFVLFGFVIGGGLARAGLLSPLSNTVKSITWESDASSKGVVSATSNDPPGTRDPGALKDVASARVQVLDPNSYGYGQRVAVDIRGGYPGYNPTITSVIKNDGLLPVRISSTRATNPSEVQVTFPDLVGFTVWPKGSLSVPASIFLTDKIGGGQVYGFTAAVDISELIYGTTTYWRYWSSESSFTQVQIEGWLGQIDGGSHWLGPRTAYDMGTFLAQSTALLATSRQAFLGQYLALRLNAASRILNPADTHDVSSIDTTNYLGFSNPAKVSLNDIIAKIEAKYYASPSAADFGKMLDICSNINNVLH